MPNNDDLIKEWIKPIDSGQRVWLASLGMALTAGVIILFAFMVSWHIAQEQRLRHAKLQIEAAKVGVEINDLSKDWGPPK